MFGYLLFLAPMAAVFFWVVRRHGVRQALLDLIAFNLFFDFDFAALLPNNVDLLLLHVLLLALVAYEAYYLLSSQHWLLSRRALLVLGMAALFVTWMFAATFANKLDVWGPFRTLNAAVRVYVLSALFVVVGLSVARTNSLLRFGTIFLGTGVAAGLISIIQTASGGQLLTNDYVNNYLGIFQPLGAKAVARRDLSETTIDYVSVVRTIRFGNLSFYRAPGPFDGAYISQTITAIIAGALLLSRGRAVRWWLFVPFICSAVGLFVAFNRSAIMTFVLVFAGLVLLRLRSLLSVRVMLRWAAPLTLAALVALWFVQPISQVVAANLDGLFGQRGSAEIGTFNGRRQLWSYVGGQIEHSPLIGTGEPITLFRANWGFDDSPDLDITAHNSILEVAYRGGVLPALILVGLFAFCILWPFVLSLDRAVPLTEPAVFFALAAAMVGLFILNQTASAILIPQVVALFWIACGYLAWYRRPSRPVVQGEVVSADAVQPQFMG